MEKLIAISILLIVPEGIEINYTNFQFPAFDTLLIVPEGIEIQLHNCR